MTDSPRQLRVFLCHASPDKSVVRVLSQRLASEDWLDVWIDENKLLPGQDWRINILDAVETSDIVVICLSNNSVNKEGYVQKELRYAQEIALEKPEDTLFLIPLRLDDCIVPRGLRFYQWVDYFDDKKEHAYQNLLLSLKLKYKQIEERYEAAEKARLEAEEKERQRIEKEKAEKEAAEKARLKAEEEEQQRIAKQKADREAAKKAAREKTEKEAAEKARLKAEEEERQRIAKEKADREAADKEVAEQARLKVEKAAREKFEKEAAEKARLKAEADEQNRIAREKVERETAEKAAREKAEKEAAEKARLKAIEKERQRIAKQKAERMAAAKLKKDLNKKARQEWLDQSRANFFARINSTGLYFKYLKFASSSRILLYFLLIGGAFIVLLMASNFGLTSLFNSPVETPSPTQTLKEVDLDTQIPKPSSTPSIPKSTKTPANTLTPTLTPTPLPTEIVDDRGIIMRLVQAGEFTMGSEMNSEKPIHQVNLGSYYIDIYEVTNGAYKACVDSGACDPPNQGIYNMRPTYYGNSQFNNFPIIYVDWNMAKTYCEWRGADLPTEAQWEKAARGDDGRTYPWGEGIDCDKANYWDGNDGCILGATEVGSYESGISPYGMYDMAGNVSEWVNDYWDEEYYQGSPSLNPTGPILGQYLVVRGGSYGSNDYNTRSTARSSLPPDYVGADIGFRCSRSLP